MTQTNGGAEFIQGELAAIPGKKLVTWMSHDGTKGVFDMMDEKVTSMSFDQLVRLWNTCISVGIIITVRRFLEERDQATGVPIKRVRMYLLTGNGKWQRMKGDVIKAFSSVDNKTGESIAPEPAVFYE